VIPDVGWGRVPDGESVRVGRVSESQLAIPDANFLLLVNAIEQPKSPENPHKVGNSGVSIGEYHKYV
jgi:hypothetical protein